MGNRASLDTRIIESKRKLYQEGCTTVRKNVLTKCVNDCGRWDCLVLKTKERLAELDHGDLWIPFYEIRWEKHTDGLITPEFAKAVRKELKGKKSNKSE